MTATGGAKKATSGKSKAASALAGSSDRVRKAPARAVKAVKLPASRVRAFRSAPIRGTGRAALVLSDNATAAFAPDTSVVRLIDVLGNNALARILGVSNSQPTRWRQGKESISPASRRRLSDLDHVLDRLLMELWPDQAGDWLTSPNAHLGGAFPIDVLVLHGAGPVLEAIDALAVGAFA